MNSLQNTVKERIADCKQKKENILNLSGLEISSIPQEIREFDWIVSLDFSENQLTKIEGLESLVNLVELNLGGNQLTKIEGLDSLVNLVELNLGENQLTKIEGLESLVNLVVLSLRGNRLKKIEGLDSLVNLVELSLGGNLLTKIEGLESLVNLDELSLGGNLLTKIEGLESLVNLVELNLWGNQLTKIEGLESLVNLVELNLWGNQLKKIESLDSLVNLVVLHLGGNQLTKIEGLDSLVNLVELSLGGNRLTKIEGLDSLVNLVELSLGGNQLTKIEGLESLVNLGELYLWRNQLTKIEGLESLVNLVELSLGENQLTKIEGLDSLVNLGKLDFWGNQLTKIEGLDSLVNLGELNLSGNQISKIEEIPFDKLGRIYLSDNPIQELPKDALNNLEALKGYLKSQKGELVSNKYLKVNIIGEGRIGKTQLFHFLNKKDYVPNDSESHGTSTAMYKIPKKDSYAQVWDFGGQSYHHGFHQVFIRPNNFNVVLWCNNDEKEPDYAYWLGAGRNFSLKGPLLLVQNVWSDSDDLDIDFTPHKVIYPESTKLEKFGVGLDETFSINVKALHSKSLNWKHKHDYFLDRFHEEILNYLSNVETFNRIPREWLSIKKKVDSELVEGLVYKQKEDFKNEYASKLDKSSFETLLYYLEFTGSILYFQDNWALKDYIFINPPKVADWIYQEILDKEFKETANGVLNFKKLIIQIGEEKASIFREIVESFHLLFEEKGDEGNLVVPQFLPENNNSFKHYLLDLLPASFSLKFTDFISEGRIFQFISEYGEYALDKSSYWKYGIIFTKSGIKSLVHYDSLTRTIFIHIEEKKGRNKIAEEIFDFFVVKEEKNEDSGKRISSIARELGLSIKEIFDFLIKSGYKKKVNLNSRFPIELEEEIYLSFNRSVTKNSKDAVFSIPTYDKGYRDFIRNLGDQFPKEKKEIELDNIIEGVQLSTNGGKHFFDIKKTIKQNTENLNVGICIQTNKTVKLDYLAITLLGMINHKLPKVFISYSRKDLEFKDELKSHLSILERYDLLKSWSCDEIRAGKWDKQIQTELEEADIIVYMVSHNFMSSEYIMEKEVKKGIMLAEENPNKKIMCVLVRECMWTAWDTLEKKYQEIAGDKEIFSDSMNLSAFQFLPYHQYKNSEGKATREEIVSLEQWGRNHYEMPNVAFKQIASKILQELK
ncbi:Leucine-rich repeat (LRR) protein [Spirosomataceae bacterium TFI 002]|nr:Leucine-rich repeat (LRR) protein [Spirosomataceae bacterium TFI 002]